ncbi:MAG: SDR family oxidoreductase [Leptolyngbyaceae cyanobacterium MO_188.B28]|nr:SDR family oxidoreductase [Leptolyngbyaceae cyanobacterium MO_188.B28]
MFAPKTILVTGASRGIGLLTVKSLANAGHYVFAAMRDLQGRNNAIARELIDWAEENDLTLETVEMDVTNESSVNATIQAIEKDRSINVLINNAGIMPTGLTEAFTPEQIKACFDVNVLGPARACRAVLPHMRDRRSGLLIHISSTAGRVAIPFFGVYCASKWALEAYAESLHYELAPFGIESILVEPGGHSTDLVKTAPAPTDQDCLLGYGKFADGRDQMLGMFERMFAVGENITDAQNVADKIVDLIEMKGPRPIRTTVGQDMGLNQINANVAPVQSELIKSLADRVKF